MTAPPSTSPSAGDMIEEAERRFNAVFADKEWGWRKHIPGVVYMGLVEIADCITPDKRNAERAQRLAESIAALHNAAPALFAAARQAKRMREERDALAAHLNYLAQLYIKDLDQQDWSVQSPMYAPGYFDDRHFIPAWAAVRDLVLKWRAALKETEDG